MSESKSESSVSSLSLNDSDLEIYKSTLRKQGALRICPACGAKESQGILPAKTPVQLFHIHEAMKGVQERFVEALIAVCTNCGSMTFHSTVLLDGKVEESSEVEGNNGE